MTLGNINTDLEGKAQGMRRIYQFGRFNEFYQENALRQYFEPGADTNGGFKSTLDQLNTLEARYSKLLECILKKEREMPNIWVGDGVKDRIHLNFLLEPKNVKALLNVGEKVRSFYKDIPKDLEEKMDQLYDKRNEKPTDESLVGLIDLIKDALDGFYNYLNSVRVISNTKEKNI